MGSIWNKGNWHWEEKNYTNFAKEWLTKQWCSIVVEEANAKIEVYEIKELNGSASVTIRKQKQLFMFEFEGELYWRATSTSAEDGRSKCQGKLKFHEFNQEDDEINTDLTCGASTPFAEGVKTAVRKTVTKRLLEEALKLVPAMKEKDIDEERLAKAKAEEQAADQQFKEATEKSGDIKKAIAEERSKKEEEMKIAEASKP